MKIDSLLLLLILNILILIYIILRIYKDFFYKKKIKYNIPNIIHFVFGLKEQTEEFLFPYYLSVLSASKVNDPDKIYFYYHYEPYGYWWERLKNIKKIVFERVELPTHIGNKIIKKTAHRADKIRMDKLYEKGGIYMDIDTISVKPYKDLLNYNTVLGYEYKPDTICNAIMLTKSNSRFFKEWLYRYESEFNSDGWGEASIYLPASINKQYPGLAKVIPSDYFFRPYATQGEDIFVKDKEIPNNLITLHLWETYTYKFLKEITNYNWFKENDKTLYSRIVRLNISEDDI